jgi:hypothetical protein
LSSSASFQSCRLRSRSSPRHTPSLARLQRPRWPQIDLAATARREPAVAVLEGYIRLERELRTLLHSAGDSKASEGLSGMALARALAEKGLVTPETVNALDGLTVLRNLVAHGRTDEVTEERARDYLALVDALAYAIRQGKSRA